MIQDQRRLLLQGLLHGLWLPLGAGLLPAAAPAQPPQPGAALSALDLSPAQAGRQRAERDEAALRALPKDLKLVKPGVLSVAIHAAVPPTSFYANDARTIIGADVDHAQLLADALGLKLEIISIAWPDWPLGLSSGKYDAVIANVGVTEQRKERFDFSTYRAGLHGFFVRKDSPIQSIREPRDIAGLRVITGSGTIQERILLEWNRLNQAAGLKAAELLYFDDATAARLALLSGRADANFNPHAPLAYMAAQEGRSRLVGTVNAGWPLKADVAVTTRKGSGLAAAFTVATNTLIANGKYARTLARWGLSAEALARSETNPPGLARL